MPTYDVTVVHTLRIVGTLTITARSEEDAHAKAKRLVDQGKFGVVSWHISGADRRMDEWQEEEADVSIEDVTEE
jgi:hypothetical protein